MCKSQLRPNPCVNVKCPHNLFWEGLNLNPEKVKITNKALEIGNCCCLISEPWTPEEIGDVWGIPSKRIMQCEAAAWKKVQKENGRRHSRVTVYS